MPTPRAPRRSPAGLRRLYYWTPGAGSRKSGSLEPEVGWSPRRSDRPFLQIPGYESPKRLDQNSGLGGVWRGILEVW